MTILSTIKNYIIDIFYTLLNQNKSKWIIISLKKEFIADNERKITRWLNMNIGDYNKDWNVFHNETTSDYMFKNKESSTMFILTWVSFDNQA